MSASARALRRAPLLVALAAERARARRGSGSTISWPGRRSPIASRPGRSCSSARRKRSPSRCGASCARRPSPADRVGVLDLAPGAGLQTQAATVRLNDTVVGRLALTPGRRRYRLPLPAEAQRAGDNVLAFRFGEAAPAAGPSGERVAAVFYSLTVGSGGDRALEDLLGRDAPAPVSIAEAESVVQVGPSILSFGLRLPPDAELRFTPRLHHAARHAGGWADLGVWRGDASRCPAGPGRSSASACASRGRPRAASRGRSGRGCACRAARRGRRFFAYAHFREPHFPYDPAPPSTPASGPTAP